MAVPNCKTVDLAKINGQIVVVVNFENSFSVWIPERERVRLTDGVTCGDIRGRNDDDDNDDDDADDDNDD